ncbi:hypothetical protein PGTUg99_035173 [Puccinia graminis f. sp. tritici]|nr:hypothetical protein PGTUg99_035173 [Puccinia graminis f. sp. tritici]
MVLSESSTYHTQFSSNSVFTNNLTRKKRVERHHHHPRFAWNKLRLIGLNRRGTPVGFAGSC